MNLASILSQTNVKPKSILRFVISGSIGLLVLWVFLVSKMDVPSERTSYIVSSDSTKSVLESRTILKDEKSIPTKQSEVQRNDSPMLQNAFTTFFVMVTVLGGIWLWVNKKRKNNDFKDQTIQVIAQHVIGQGAQLKIIEINDEIWVLGISANAVNLLHRYTKQDWHPSKLSDPDSKVAPDNNFNSIFKLLRN